ncbi:MAG TPA: phage tail protein [Candidatus Sulfotelmatobacter sp.]|jgi:hypothetical protein|nr:phage tail protein [Candidatus Sulfotelmatobacter sp.]
MSTLFGGGKKTQAQTQSTVTDLQVQTSTQGAVVPVVYGTQKVAGNLIWYGDFTSIPHYSSSASGGGKGGGGGSSSSVDYTYQTAIAFAVSAGKVVDVARIWWEKNLYSLSSVPGNALLKQGDVDQEPWSYLSSKHADQALHYPGLAYVGISAVDLGSSYNLPNITYEVLGKGPAASVYALSGVSHSIDLSSLKTAPADTGKQKIAAQLGSLNNISGNYAFDTSPAYCFYDLLVNDVYGASFPTARLADLSDYALWCEALGITMSVSLDQAQDARSVLQGWLKMTQAEAVWAAGTLTIVPYADSTVSATRMDGTIATYSPDLTPVMSIDDSIMLHTEEDEPPLTVTRKDPADAKNRITLEYTDRSNAYALTVVTSEDPAHISRYGLRADSSATAHEFTSGTVAQTVADLLLARSTNIVATYEWRMGGLAALLKPMDIVALSDIDQGLSATPVRILEIEEEDDTVFRVKAEAVPGAVAVAVERPLQASLGYRADYGAFPGDISPPVMFEPPSALTGGALELWVAASGGENWGGANVWVSADGETYASIGSITLRARQGVLSTALAAGGSLDVINAFQVDLSLSRSTLSGCSAVDAAAYNTLCYVDGELLSFQDAELVSPHGYRLSTLYRGAYGSTVSSHAEGSQFARLDGGIFKYAFTAAHIGKTLQIKFTSFNLFGGAEQSLADVAPYSFTVQGSALTLPLPNITGLSCAYVSGIAQLTWDSISDERSPDFEIRKGASWNSAVFIRRTSVPQAPTAGDGVYWVAAHFTVADGYEIYSAVPAMISVSGAQIVSNVIASHDEWATGWSGAKSGLSVVHGYLQMSGAADLSDVDIPSLADVIYGDGAEISGTYTIPEKHRIDVGRIVNCPVAINVQAMGQPCRQDLRFERDVLLLQDVCGVNLGPSVSVSPQIRLSQDAVAWGDWQSWTAGSYLARAYDARLLVSTRDVTAVPVVEGFSFLVDVPDRLDSFTGLAVPISGLQVNFTDGLGGNPAAAFNGGPNGEDAPNVLATVLNGDSADTPVISELTKSGFFIQVLNGGQAVVRTVNIIAQGY